MARNRKKVLSDFIDSIPDSKLQGFPDSEKTLYFDQDLRLDMQCVTSRDQWNLQIQVNRRPKTTALRRMAGKTVAGPVLVPRTAPMTPEEIREAFRAPCIYLATPDFDEE
ncbi:hypothetical protein C8A03DRAFT_37641 [Achaetomium macrosporum]|uniref:Uncharacterized protein n=1 Tax=Achaetomium macrosporum TaxID=79813 RepID=A0AAN7C391_9PEZI|nr:hypothetical protein C8A03DRAFT_37641 [Achaetomium macrosporum]